MFDNAYLQVGAGHYTQHQGALHLVGREVAPWGDNAYIVTDETVWGKTRQRVEPSLKNAGVAYTVEFCGAPSTQLTFDAVARRGQAAGAQVYIGLGGGRVIDIAKGASVQANARVVTAPTSATNCSAYAVLYVTYAQNGFVEKSQWLKHEASAVLVDTDYAVLDCPARYLSTGIADAMAKKPEFIFTMQKLGSEGEIATSVLAKQIGSYNYDLMMDKGRAAMKDAAAGKVSGAVDDVVCAAIMLTGMVSDLSTGGKSLAIAHNFYDAVCGLRPGVRRNFTHGELVGLSIPLQMYVNGDAPAEIDKFKAFMRDIGVPTRLAQVGIDDADVDDLVDYTYKVTMEDPALHKAIKEGFNVMK